MADSLPLNDCHVRKFRLLVNRLHFVIHGVALMFLLHYRITSLLQIINSGNHGAKAVAPPILPHVLTLIAEAFLILLWLLGQPSKWRPVVRAVYPERLPGDDRLPAIDVFVCTADPNKEPSLTVMNTVLSALALDYPPDKLHVYVSDDGGSHATLLAAREAWNFAKFWIPFCRKYKVKNRCPEAYFREEKDDSHGSSTEFDFLADEKDIQRKYEDFKSRVSEIVGRTEISVSNDHPAVIEVISNANGDENQMPFLAYLAREKRPSQPHHFKAGALNVLFRVSAILTNSPYILMLDCDMYCNDPTSARQAMCFLLDPELSPKLGFVQFPQKFYSVNHYDIYDGRMRFVWEKWEGLDGIMGPVLSGTCFYVKRKAIYGAHSFQDEHVDFVELKKWFGSSNEFIKSMSVKYKLNQCIDNSLQKELQLLASCSYDQGTKWGSQVGFRYFCLVEDYFTGFNLHCEGWKSVYIDPQRACFLGSSPITLGDHMVQHSRWYFGLHQVAWSRFSPLLYGPWRMSLWQSMCYAEIAHMAFYFLPLYVLAIVPQLCLLRGISLYPEVSSPYFALFTFIFLSSQLKHMQEVLSTGFPIYTWLLEQRIWMIRSLGPYLYATVDGFMEKIGLRAARFLPTNKVVHDEVEKRYQSGMYDFQAPAVFMVPLCTLYLLNLASLLLSLRSILKANEMLIQGLIPLFVVVVNFPLFEGMVVRKDKGKVPPFVCLVSSVVCVVVLSFASLVD